MSMVEPLVPWADGFHEGTSQDLRIARLFAAVPEPAPVSDVVRQRLALRLHTRARRSAGLMLVRLIVIGVGIGVAGAAAAQWATTHLFSTQRELVSPRAPVVVERPPLVPQPSLPRAVTLPEEVMLPEAPVAVEQAPSTPAPAAAGAPQSSRLGLEAASLEAALSALRGGKGGAARALTAIDQHLQSFPGGALELEARVARIDAFLLLGRRLDARRELSALPIDAAGRSRELRLIRAELRADDDCRAAIGDFQVLVDQALPPAFQERALFGRGACLLRLGDNAAAQRDFARYLEKFPQGRFADQIRAQQH